MYTGWPKSHAGLKQGMNSIAAMGPDLQNLYYTYYATQAIFQYTDGKGPQWNRYNEALRDPLIAGQARQGHEQGSWTIGQHAGAGGRIYSTSLACMCLEVYYRHMPIYRKGGFGEGKASKPLKPPRRKRSPR